MSIRLASTTIPWLGGALIVRVKSDERVKITLSTTLVSTKQPDHIGPNGPTWKKGVPVTDARSRQRKTRAQCGAAYRR